MDTAWIRVLTSLLILVGGLMGFSRTVAASSPAFITIRVYNYAKVAPQTQLKAEKAAAEVFRKAGVEIEWVDSPVTSESRLENATDRRASDASQMRLLILSTALADSMGLPNNVMGLAPGAGPNREQAYVFYGRVKELALRQMNAAGYRRVDRPATTGQILGTMIAHELGHVLLNMPSHSETGIMRGKWDLKDLQDTADGKFLFTPEQSVVMRAEVVRRSGKVQVVEVTGLDAQALAH